MELFDHQKRAVEQLKPGSILQGGVGSGKTLTALAYFKKSQSDKILYVITTARKRDTLDWEKEASNICVDIEKVDSWNNIHKYKHIKNAFFIFDEQRLIGAGKWVKNFLKIAENNKWILLTATPGDNWSDYIPVLIANGFYKNRSEFIRRHVVYKRFSKFPIVDYYLEVHRLIRLRDSILVQMFFQRKTISHDIDIFCDYNRQDYKRVQKDRYDIFKQEPIRDAAGLCYALRRVVNQTDDRVDVVLNAYLKHKKIIVFYNFDYELKTLERACMEREINFSQWNGHKHEPHRKADRWIYLNQYAAASEAWNCTETNCIVFFSQNYSYKVMVQASGRIDRLNTEFVDLYYYHLISDSSIDKAIRTALINKQNFNENIFSES